MIPYMMGFFVGAWDVLVTAGNFIDTRKSNGGRAVFFIALIESNC